MLSTILSQVLYPCLEEDLSTGWIELSRSLIDSHSFLAYSMGDLEYMQDKERAYGNIKVTPLAHSPTHTLGGS